MISNRLKEIRTDKDISQKTLSEMVGISRQALHAIENGLSCPSVEIALKLAQAMEVKLERLFWLTETAKSTGDITPFTLFNHKLVDDKD